MKKWIILTSSILIFLSTIGISYDTYFLDNEIENLKSENVEEWKIINIYDRETYRAEGLFNNALNTFSTLKLLEETKASIKIKNWYNEKCMLDLRLATMAFYELVPDSLKINYPELKKVKDWNVLNKLYIKWADAVSQKRKFRKEKIDKFEKDIIFKESISRKILIFSLILNSIGLILGIFASCLENKKTTLKNVA